MSHASPSLASLSDASSNVLLLGADSPATDDACRTLVGGPDPDGTDVLGVTYRPDPDDRLRSWRLRADDRTGTVRLVDVGTTTRSASATRRPARRTGPGPTVTTVEDPGDLTGLGIHLVELLADRESDGRRGRASDGGGNEPDAGGRIAVCFHSVSDLLQYVGVERAFRFLHVLLVRLRSVDACAHFHLDPTRHDDRTVAVLSGLFDAVVEVDGDEVAVRRR